MAIINHMYVAIKPGFFDDVRQAENSEIFGGFNPKTKTMKPFLVEPYSQQDYPTVADMLESIAAAAEAKLIDDEQWPTQLFASRTILDAFMGELESYEDSYRITDYWWQALASLRGHLNEEGAVRGEEMADELMARIAEIEDDGIELSWLS